MTEAQRQIFQIYPIMSNDISKFVIVCNFYILLIKEKQRQIWMNIKAIKIFKQANTFVNYFKRH